MERNIRKNANLSSAQKERELFKIALDQVYVAHYPMDAKYLPLFSQGVRRVDHGRLLTRRAHIRQRVLLQHRPEAKSWISAEQYQRARSLDGEWSVEREAQLFGQASTSESLAATHDERFSVPTQQHEALLAAAEKMEAELDQQQEEEKQSSKSSDSETSSSDEDDADPLKPQSKTPGKDQSPPETKESHNEGDSSTSSDDSSVSSSSESSTSSIDSSGDEAQVSKSAMKMESKDRVVDDVRYNSLNDGDDDMEDDDFFAPATNVPEEKIFDNPKERMSASDPFKGDKSKGWATQRQRPGQFRNQRKKTWR